VNIESAQFGSIDIDERQLITFDNGIPGFESYRIFALLTPNAQMPFSFLQSLDDKIVAFILTNPFLFYPEYEFELHEEAAELLRIRSQEEVTVWSIVSVGSHMSDSTLNLLAPVIINPISRKGKQVILHGSGYLTKHPLRPNNMDSANSTEVKENANAGLDA